MRRLDESVTELFHIASEAPEERLRRPVSGKQDVPMYLAHRLPARKNICAALLAVQKVTLTGRNLREGSSAWRHGCGHRTHLAKLFYRFLTDPSAYG